MTSPINLGGEVARSRRGEHGLLRPLVHAGRERESKLDRTEKAVAPASPLAGWRARNHDMFRRTVEQQAFQPPRPPSYKASDVATWIPVRLSSRETVHVAVEYIPAPKYASAPDAVLVRPRPSAHGSFAMGAYSDQLHRRSGTTPPYTIVFSHGNGEDLGTAASFLEELAHVLQVRIWPSASI